MKNKAFILTLTAIITVLCIYYLSFNLISYNIEKKADIFSTEIKEDNNEEISTINTIQKQTYLDSLWNEVVYDFFGFYQYTYKDIKENGLSLGLDLQGGIHLTLEISPKDILLGLSDGNKDSDFQEALAKASEAQKNSQTGYVDLFLKALKEVNPNKTLADIFANSANRSNIDYKSSDEDVEKFIKIEVKNATARAFNIIRTRIDKFGVSQPNIQLIPGTGRIQVELPGANNPKRVKKLLQGVAKLEFLEVWPLQDAIIHLQSLDKAWLEYEKSLSEISTKIGDTFNLIEIEEDSIKEASEELTTLTKNADNFNDGSDKLSDEDDLGFQDLLADEEVETQIEQENIDEIETPTDSSTDKNDTSIGELYENTDSLASENNDSTPQETSALFNRLASQNNLVYSQKDTGTISKILNYAKEKNIVPKDMFFLWGVKPIGESDQTGESFFQVYTVKRYQSQRNALTGEAITDARQDFDRNGSPDISMTMNVQGAKKWAKMTRENIDNQIAIILDNYVYSAPVVQSEIPNGQSSISGSFTIEEAQDLANILKAGKLPAPTRIVEEAIVGPTLSLQSQKQGITSIVSGLLLIVIFMILYYGIGGGIANVALLVNIFFIMGLLANFNAALTLPGIAGIVLTIGMSIDANVLIFERIKEELANKTQNTKLRVIVAEGYKKAYWTIFDSNLTTLITAVILYLLGAGPVKGFAVTLIIGVLCSFFSAVFITRMIVEWAINRNKSISSISFDTFVSKSILKNMNFKFLNHRKIAYVFSGLLILIGIGVIISKGLNLGVDFQGGRSFVVEFSQNLEPSDVKSSLTQDLNNASIEVKTYGANKTLKITTNYLVDDESAEADSIVSTHLHEGLNKFSGETLVENIEGKLPENTFRILSTNKVGSTIADDIKNTSQKSILLAIIAIFLYITLRFRKSQFGIGAVIALVHDSLMVLSVFAIADLFGITFEIDQIFIAAMLTIVGYSINDTVVVFDRVREELNQPNKSGNKISVSLLNTSINKTLSRTLITSLTTLLVVIILLVFGGESLRGFSFALLVGILFGTYSSIFIATPIVFEMRNLKFPWQTSKESLNSKI